MKTKIFRIIILLTIFTLSFCKLHSQANLILGKQFGTDMEDVSENAISDDLGNLFIAGYTEGQFSKERFGKSDGFISRLDNMGNIVWTKQFGSDEEDKIHWITSDSEGNLIVTGSTKGKLENENYGLEDILVVKFNNQGDILWQKQFGTDSSEIGKTICADINGNIYVAGSTKGKLGKNISGKKDCFVLKLDKNGNLSFINQFGSKEDDECHGITTDNELNIYLCGRTWGDLASKSKGLMDAFLMKYNRKGELINSLQFGSESYEWAARIALDKHNNIYLGCSTYGSIAAEQQGEGDCLLVKLDGDFKTKWSKQWGTKKWDGINGIDINEMATDNIVISGCQYWPECQSFCRIYSQDGELIWKGNYIAKGEGGGTCGKGMCLNNKGQIYHVGITGGNLFNSNQGKHDIFVIKLVLEQ